MAPLLLAPALATAPCPTTCEELFQPPSDTRPVPAGQATEPDINLSATWLALQLLPSPALALGEGAAHLRLSWQVTPVLYSWGIDPRLSGWRSLIAEPIVRHSGSLELLLSPEYVSWPGRFADRWGYRAGLRSTFGLIERGDYLSFSLGTGVVSLHEGTSVEHEVGVYILFGNFGITLQYAPAMQHTVYTSTLRLRFF